MSEVEEQLNAIKEEREIYDITDDKERSGEYEDEPHASNGRL